MQAEHERTGRARIDPARLRPLHDVLGPLANLLGARLWHGEAPTVATIEQAGEQARQALGACLADSATDVATLHSVAVALQDVAEGPLWPLTFFAETTPFERTEAYGMLDPQRFRAAFRALHGCIEAIELAVVPRAAAERNDAVFVQAVDLLVFTSMRLGAPDGAIALLESLVTRHGRAELWEALERAYLSRADCAAAASTRQRGGLDDAATVHRAYAFGDWARAEGLMSRTLVADPAEQGTFDVVRVDGRVRVFPHQVPAVNLLAAQVHDLRAVAPYLLLGPAGHLLRPSRYIEYGEFPYPAPALVNRARGEHIAATLRPARPGPPTEIAEPVLVLDHLHLCGYNYYHWLLETLSRIAVVLTDERLKDRRVLIPAKVRPWMRESLAHIGLPERQIRYIRPDDHLLLRDAVVVSSVDFSSRSLARALRERFRQAAGVSPQVAKRGTRLLYLSRRGHAARALAGAEEVETLARRLGYEVVAPETLGLLDQVRLFSEARAIAGVAGAAFTNQVFAPEGIRVLGMAKEEDNEPTYINLAHAMGQACRCLLGTSLTHEEGPNPLATPFSVPFDLVAQHLEWAAG